MKKLLNKIIISAVPFLASLLIRFLAKTVRILYVDFDRVWDDWRDGKNIILAFWHGRLLMMPVMYKGLSAPVCRTGRRRAGRGISVLVSRHRDGELIARTIKRFGIDSARGSSTRGWLGGVKGLLKEVKKGRDIAITPDGPKGPGFNAQMGIINIAKITGLPIIPMTFSASKKKLLIAGTALLYLTHFQKACLSAAPPSL